MSLEANKQIVLDYFENISAGNFDAALALLADTATWWVAGKPDKFLLAGTRSKEQFAEMLQGIGAAMPKGVHVTPKGITAEGDRVALEAETHGETANGKRYSNQYHYLCEVRGGKIQTVREYLDTMHAKEVLLSP